MLVQEILDRKRYLSHKLEDLELYMQALASLEVEDKAQKYNTSIERKFALLTKIRSHVTLLDRLNRETCVYVGAKELPVYDVVKLRDTLKGQIQTLDSLIRYGDLAVINIFTLLDQRDDLYEEYELLHGVISVSDNATDWSGEEED